MAVFVERKAFQETDSNKLWAIKKISKEVAGMLGHSIMALTVTYSQ